jgi:beta-fructofuranosidase
MEVGMLSNLISLVIVLLAAQQSPPAWSSEKASIQPKQQIARAMKSVLSAASKLENDPIRPVFHFRPSAQWMNDPNGTIYHGGYYHVFYQHNPFGDGWGNMHWGHARSKDLVHWEHRPIALWPSKEKGEEHCFSGSARVNSEGIPLLFYTSVAFKDNGRPFEQWIATGDKGFDVWHKHKANPVLDLEGHGGPAFGASWRDPFLFEEEGRTFMVLGADTETEAVVPLYESKDGKLLDWEYKGILFRQSKTRLKFFECPNFLKVDGQWVLIYAPYRSLEYHQGSFSLETLEFKPVTAGILDYSSDRGDFYASNIAYDEKGLCILFGWFRGFPEGRGWNGCLALPRVLSIDANGNLIQSPVEELAGLRGGHVSVSEQNLLGGYPVEGVASDTLEIHSRLRLGSASTVGLKVRSSESGDGVRIQYDGENLEVAGVQIPLERSQVGEVLELRVFLDKSVLEVFVEGGLRASTRVIEVISGDIGLEFFSEGGEAAVVSADIWDLKPIW